MSDTHRVNPKATHPPSAVCCNSWHDTACLSANCPDCQSGFTLVELLIVMSVVAILAAVATPLYSDQMRRSNRASAQAVLLDAAVHQRQLLMNQPRVATSISELGLSVPSSLSGKYAVTIEAASAAVSPAFRIVATPSGAQAADRCGTLSVDQAGARLPIGCW